jgi:alanine dehydrogenase
MNGAPEIHRRPCHFTLGSHVSPGAVISVIPARVEELVRRGHQVLVEPDAGLNIHAGKITHRAVADVLGHPHLPASEVLKR